MKTKKAFLLGVIVTVLAVSLLWVGIASATTGCFNDTNGHWAETYICWMADTGITGGVAPGEYGPQQYVNRAQMAVFMKKLDDLTLQQTDDALSTGDVYITFGPNEWVANAAYSGYVEYYTIWNFLRAPSSGTYLYQATPALPSSLYGHLMYIEGVQICYDATNGGYLDYVTLDHYKTKDDGSTVTLNTYTDDTNRSDATCRIYNFASSGSFFGDNHLAIKIYYYLSSASDYMRVSSTTVILSPSGGVGTLDVEQDGAFSTVPTGPETGE